MPKKTEIKKTKNTDSLEKIYQEISQPPISGGSIFSFRNIVLIVVLSLIGGLAAGFIQDRFLGDFLNLNQKGNDQQTATSTNQNQVLDLNFLVNQTSDNYSKVLTEIRGKVVGFYRAKKTSGILDSIYLEKDFLGSGIVVTSDGWLLTHKSVLDGEDFMVVTGQKEIFEPVDQVADPFSGLVLVKIDKDGLSPARFAEVSNLSATSPLLVTRYSVQNHGSDIVQTALQKFSYHDQSKGSDFLLSSDKLDHYLKVDSEFETVYDGAALINDNNEVVGLMFYSGRSVLNLALPAYYLKSTVDNFLVNSQEVMRSRLGVNYIDLSEALGLSDEVNEGRSKGAVLLGDASRDILAVEEGSPAETAGLKAGDIVLKVNGEEINEDNSLTRLIQDYTPGHEITLTIVRDGEDQEVKATLGEL